MSLSNKPEMSTPQLLSNTIKQAKTEGKVSSDIDERVASFVI